MYWALMMFCSGTFWFSSLHFESLRETPFVLVSIESDWGKFLMTYWDSNRGFENKFALMTLHIQCLKIFPFHRQLNPAIIHASDFGAFCLFFRIKQFIVGAYSKVKTKEQCQFEFPQNSPALPRHKVTQSLVINQQRSDNMLLILLIICLHHSSAFRRERWEEHEEKKR